MTDQRQALMLGLCAGAGFAITENMLYQGIYARTSGWTWGGITLLRGIGSVLHPLCTGLVALGWFRARGGGGKRLGLAYLAAVGLHTLWNGGFQPLLFLTGFDQVEQTWSAVSVYGLAVEIGLVVFLVLLSAGLWWLLGRLVNRFARGEPEMVPLLVSRRALALWAFACALVIVPIGAALGPVWDQISSFILAQP